MVFSPGLQRSGPSSQGAGKAIATPRDEWKPHARTSRSVTADVYYDRDGECVGQDMTFPTRKFLVQHLRDFVYRKDLRTGTILAWGTDRDGEFRCEARIGPSGGVYVDIVDDVMAEVA